MRDEGFRKDERCDATDPPRLADREADQLLPAGAEPADLGASLRHDLAGREAGGQGRAQRRGLLRAALHGRGVPGEDRLAGQRSGEPRGRRPAAGLRPGEGGAGWPWRPTGPARRPFDADGELLFARIAREDLGRLDADFDRRRWSSRPRQTAAGGRGRSADVELHLGPGPGQPRATGRGLRRGRAQRHRGHGRAAQRHPRQPQGRLHRPRRPGASRWW